MVTTTDDEKEGWFEIYDLNALAEADDKAKECRYFLGLIETEKNWNHFRWLTSAFLGAAYSFFEIQALRAFSSFWHPETGEPTENNEALTVLRRYVAVFQDAKRASYVSLSKDMCILSSRNREGQEDRAEDVVAETSCRKSIGTHSSSEGPARTERKGIAGPARATRLKALSGRDR